MDLLRICHDFGITHKDRTSAGWINIHCPFCAGSKDFHLGYNIIADYFVCWRCGWKAKEKAIAGLINVSQGDASKVILRYEGKSIRPAKRQSRVVEVKRKGFKYPTRCNGLTNAHRRYLISRKFDPDFLIEKYKIMGTGPASSLDGLDMKWRIIVPIVFNGREVSWQSRNIKDFAKNNPRQKYKYITCSKERERIFHKDILYNYDLAKEHDWCVVCEGIMDVWRLGDHAVATFGTKYKMKQIQLLKKFRTVFIAYDPDPAGQENAKKMKAQLEWAGVRVEIITNMPCDPGDMNQDYADEFMAHLEETAETLL